MNRDHWPGAAWRNSGGSAIAEAPLADMLELIRVKRHAIDAILVQRGREVVFDCAFQPYRPGAPHPLYSCTKTIVGILLGIAIDKEYIESVERPIVDFLPAGHPARSDPRKRAITLRHFLTMTTGLDIEDHGGDFRGYFAMTRSDDLFDRVVRLPVAFPPGEKFKYNNGGSHVLACVLQAATGMTPLEFARDNLFAPLGIEKVAWDRNEQAGNTGWAGLSLTARDLAKIGRLYLDDGIFDGRRIVSSEWVRESIRAHVTAKPHGHYGYHWWVEPNQFEAIGLFGQYAFALPGHDAVVVIFSTLAPGDFLLPKYLLGRFILPALSGAGEKDAFAGARLHSLMAQAQRPGPDDRLVWRAPEEGMVEEGEFRRSAAPAFRFRCPPRATKQRTTWKYQVGALNTFEGFPFFVSVNEIPRGVAVENAGAHFAAGLRNFGPVEQFDILSNRPFTLACGAQAYRTDIRYQFRGSNVCTASVLSAYRDNKWVCLEGHTPGDPNEMAAIVESLMFEK